MQEELIEKWSVISAFGTVPDLSIFSWMKKGEAESIMKNVAFARDMITSEIPKGVHDNKRQRVHRPEKDDQGKASSGSKGKSEGHPAKPGSISGSHNRTKTRSPPRPRNPETVTGGDDGDDDQ